MLVRKNRVRGPVMYGYDPAMLSNASISNPNVMIKMHDIFNKHGSTSKLPRPRPTDIVYVISDGYATFQSLI